MLLIKIWMNMEGGLNETCYNLDQREMSIVGEVRLGFFEITLEPFENMDSSCRWEILI
jgi:hypothetical protein